MDIDVTKYVLTSNNYIETETPKTQIIIGHTFNHDMKHYNGWLHRYNGKFKRTAAFTIDAAGFVYRHFNPKYHSRLFNNPDLDKKTIVILIENDGWLMKNGEKNEFITWIGDIYKQPNEVIEKKWRGYNHWSPYSNQQLESTVSLIKELCGEFSIPINSISHNTKIDGLLDYKGILYKSNLEKFYTDPSPAWNCEFFKHKLEQI